MDSLSQYILEFCLEQSRGMLGSNSVTEGNPTANISSGSFAVLLVNVAQRYASENQEAHDSAITESANDALELTRKHAQNGFWADIAGLGDAPYAEIIKQDKLKSLRRVKLVRQSPVLSTFPGRIEVFDRLVKLPKRERADAADMMLTGRMESFAERDQAAKIRIRKENEWLLQGINPVVTMWDDHATEGPEHRMEYDKVRTMDPPGDGPNGPNYMLYQMICKAFDDHMLQHTTALAQTLMTNPFAAMVAGWAPPADGGQPQQGGGGGGLEQGNKPAPGGGEQAPKAPKSPSSPRAPKAGAGAAGSDA
jgi:hypothetical protein